MIKHVMNIFYGIILGVSNVIPGVSAGTMAVVLNIYDELLGAVSLKKEHLKKNLIFLATIGIGAVVGILVFSNAITFLFEKYNMPTNFLFIGIIIGILFSLLLKNSAFKGEPIPFVMELPNYRFPSPKSVWQLIWYKAKDFITRAFTIIFVATIIIWFLQTFDLRLNVVSDSSKSLLAGIGGFISPIFAPLGFGDWRISTALITGFTAKESVVSTLTVLLGGKTSALSTLFTPFTAFVFLIFTLLYTPCVAAIACVKRELGSRKAALEIVLLQCGIAWIVAFIIHTIGSLLGIA